LKTILDLESTPGLTVLLKPVDGTGNRSDGPREQAMQTTTLAIDGMHCEGCVQIVQHLLEHTPGVKGATVSLDAKQARIAFDASQVSAETLAEAINRAGYKAVPTA